VTTRKRTTQPQDRRPDPVSRKPSASSPSDDFSALEVWPPKTIRPDPPPSSPRRESRRVGAAGRVIPCRFPGKPQANIIADWLVFNAEIDRIVGRSIGVEKWPYGEFKRAAVERLLNS
jgi:hypothetical protein